MTSNLAASCLFGGLVLTAVTVKAAESARVFPGKSWARKTPAEAGLDKAKLAEFSKLAGGRGCVVRNGYLVFTWGDDRRRGDVASAAKPVYAHFLFRALQDGRIPSLDERVARYEPRLVTLNRQLGYKDRLITWRHLANQISCYGVTEKPGTAFDYSDWQMALFWDLLFTRVYRADYKTVDEKVLRPLLANPLQCEDQPTFMAFGTKNRPGRLAISPRDFARFGLLYLHRGTWNGRKLLDEKYARMAVSTPLPLSIPRTRGKKAGMIASQRSIGGGNNQTDHNGGYSWLWWINGLSRDGKRWWEDAPPEMFTCLGHGGKRGLAVFPTQQLIASWNDTKPLHTDRKLGNRAFRLLAEAVKKPPEKNQSGFQTLSRRFSQPVETVLRLVAGGRYEAVWWNPSLGTDGRFQKPGILKGGLLWNCPPPAAGDWAVRIRRAIR